MPLALARDHPRGCGEKHHADAAFVDAQGSSPRVRGKALRLCGCRAASGIIPAGAGKSMNLRLVWICLRDHPRGCGEKSRLCTVALAQGGSSPRVRGKAMPTPRPSPLTGIIPAGAGKR